jgi:hypothetical protein
MRLCAGHTLDNHDAILGPFEAMFACFPIGGTVVPRLCRFDGRKFENDHAFDLRTLDHFVMAISNAHADRVTGQSGGAIFWYVSTLSDPTCCGG